MFANTLKYKTLFGKQKGEWGSRIKRSKGYSFHERRGQIMQFLSNPDYIWVLDAVLLSLLVLVVCLWANDRRKHRLQLKDAYRAGYSAADAAATLVSSVMYGPRLAFDEAFDPDTDHDSMLTHLERAHPKKDTTFDEHVSVYEDWRDNGTSLIVDNRPHLKTKDKRTPMQLVSFDSAGYMD